MIDGVRLDGLQAGDVYDLPEAEACLLIAERWAILERRERNLPWPNPERRKVASSSGSVQRP